MFIKVEDTLINSDKIITIKELNIVNSFGPTNKFGALEVIVEGLKEAVHWVFDTAEDAKKMLRNIQLQLNINECN